MGRDSAVNSAKVAATNVTNAAPERRQRQPEVTRNESYAERLCNSPPIKQQRCNVCDGYHFTLECAILARLEPNGKVAKMRECRLCLNCGERNHLARNCPSAPAKCLSCHRNHLTILHGRTFPPSGQRLNVNAPAFRQAPTSDANPSVAPMGSAAAASTAPITSTASTASPAAPSAPPQSMNGNPII